MDELIFIEIAGGVIMLLLAIIARFLKRLLEQFDKLNETMVKMDKDISGKIGIIEVQTIDNGRRLSELDPLWERMRLAENDIAIIKSMMRP